MSHSPLRIRKAAVLGAGVMGAQIAAHLVNADVDTVLFDLAAKDGDPNGVVLKAIGTWSTPMSTRCCSIWPRKTATTLIKAGTASCSKPSII